MPIQSITVPFSHMKTSKKTKTFARQLISFTFIFMLLLFLLAILVVRQLLFEVMLDAEETNIGNLAEANVQIIDKQLSGIMTLATGLQTVLNDGFFTPDEIEHHLNHLLVDNPELVSVCLAYDPPSRTQTKTFKLDEMMIRSIPAGNDDFLYKDWYQIPWLAQKQYWSDPWFDAEGSGQIVCSYSLPLTIRGTRLGIIRLDTPMESLRRIVMSLRVRKTGFAYLVSSNGMIVAHPSDSLAMNYTLFDLATRYQREDIYEIGQKVVNGQTGFERVRIHQVESDNWLAYRPLPSNHWSLVVEVPNREVFADLRYLTIIFTIASLASFLIIAGTIWYRTNALNQPLTELVDSIKLAGGGDLQPGPEISSDTYEIQVITENFAKMKSSLAEYIDDLKLVTEEKNRILAEVSFASAIQRNLVPKNADVSKLPPNLATFGILEPAGSIGGDLYDYFLSDANHFLFAIADVVGKGVPAAMSMTMLTTLLRATASADDSPETILLRLNAFLQEHNLESDFVTMVLGIIELDSGRCAFSNAGHPPLYQLSPNGRFQKYATTHSTALGFFDNIRITSETLQLSPGDQIVVFTDGVTEAMNQSEELFGSAGLENVLSGLQGSHPESTAHAIISAVRDFADPQSSRDDTTILVIEYLRPLQS